MTTISEMMADARAIAKRINGTVGGLPSMIDQDEMKRRHGHRSTGEVAERREQVADLYMQGLACAAIAKQLGVPKTKVNCDIHLLRKTGVIDYSSDRGQSQ